MTTGADEPLVELEAAAPAAPRRARAVLGVREQLVDVELLGPTRRLSERIVGEQWCSWTIALVRVEGEHEPRWIDVERIEDVPRCT